MPPHLKDAGLKPSFEKDTGFEKRVVIAVGCIGRAVSIIAVVERWTRVKARQVGKALESYTINREIVRATILRRPGTEIGPESAHVGGAGNRNRTLPGYVGLRRNVANLKEIN